MALQRQQPKSTALQLTAVAVAVLCPWLAVSVPLSDWHSGIATNYGGAQDGMSPYDPSFGTKEVREKPYQGRMFACRNYHFFFTVCPVRIVQTSLVQTCLCDIQGRLSQLGTTC